MPRLKVITEKDIEAAIQQITGQGEEPTAIRLRDMLGSGSFSTFSRAIKQWRQSTGRTFVAREDVPRSIGMFVLSTCEQLIAELTEKCERLTLENKELREQIDYLNPTK